MFKKNSIMPWMNWGITSSFVLFQFFLQATSGLMAKSWVHDFNLTTTQLGSLSAAFFMTYVLIQIPVGLAYDRFGARKVLILASSLLTAGIFLLALSQNYLQAYLSRMLMGLGSGFGFVGMLYVTASWFSGRQFAMMVGLAETLAMMGVALGEIGMAWMVTHLGWRSTFVLAGILSMMVIALVYLFIYDQTTDLKTNKESYPVSKALKQVVKTKQVWITGLYGFAMVAVVNVFSTLWGVPFLLKAYAPISLHTVSSLIAMTFLGLGLGGPCIAWLVERFDKRRLFMRWFACITTLSFILILYGQRLPIYSLSILLFILGFFSAGYIQVFAVVKDSIPIKLRATALATVNMILMSSAPILQPLIGKAIDMGFSYTEAISIQIMTLLLAILCSFAIDKRAVKNLKTPADCRT